MGALDDAIAMLAGMPPAQAREAIQIAQESTKHRIWVPNPGPQTDAFFSDADELLFGGEAGGGKDLAIDTPIPTPYGWKTMGELAVGDAVFDETGAPCSVIAKSEIFNHDTYRITFSDGATVVAGAGHQWVTSNYRERSRALKGTAEYRAARKENRPSRGTGKRPDLSIRNTAWAKSMNLPVSGTRTTSEIMASVLCRGGRLNHAVKISGALQLPPAELVVDPYTLGAWLGDGTTASGAITGIDEEVFANVANSYQVRPHANPISRGVIGLKVKLRSIGVLGNKHIPVVYLRSSFDQRLALLQGLMDTDGYCDTRGQCEISLVNKRLIDDVHELVLSLGIKASVAHGIATLNGVTIGPKWRIKFLTEHQAFRLSRKLIRQKRHGFRGTHCQRYIVKIDPVDSVPTQCIQVDSPNRMYLCGREMIPTHNSDLIIGLSMTEHSRSLVLRRTNKEAEKLFDRYEELCGGDRDGFNSQKGIVRDGRIIDIGGCQLESDKQKRKGIPHDLKAFDELVDFTESQYLFITIWVRSANPKQRTRIVSTTNPPTRPEGMWVVKRWAPWLDPKHPNPAKDGELRWFTTINKVDTEVDGPGPHIINGKDVFAKSRTFIRSKLSDNPDLTRTSDYQNTLNALPEELRQAYAEGRFDAGLKDAPFQAVPTAWIRAAMERWVDKPRQGVPMCGMGVDCTGGGDDPMVISNRHDGWFAPLVIVEGKEIPADRVGKVSAGHVLSWRRDKAIVVVDMGGGYGGALFEALKDNDIAAVPHKGAEGTSQRTKDGQFGFANKRSQLIWRMREALDPDQVGGSPIDLPPDPILMADLSAPCFWVGKKDGLAVIEIEQKVKVCARIGRSTDRGDAVVMAWSAGPTYITDGDDWRAKMEREQGHMFGGKPQVVMGKGGIRLTGRGRR